MTDTPERELIEEMAKALHEAAVSMGESGSRRTWQQITSEERDGFSRLAAAAYSSVRPHTEALVSRVDKLEEALRAITREYEVYKEVGVDVMYDLAKDALNRSAS